MNDVQIRESFHCKKLRRHHAAPDTLIVDELGLKHGKCRADIAVINGQLTGYEIKSNQDTLSRLSNQVESYSDVFDRVVVVVGTKHADAVRSLVPDWWGIIACRAGVRGGITFETARKPRMNMAVDPFSVAQLLWRNEAESILSELGTPRRILRQKRMVLYRSLVDLLDPVSLRRRVRECLKRRRNWRLPARLFLDGDSFPHVSK